MAQKNCHLKLMETRTNLLFDHYYIRACTTTTIHTVYPLYRSTSIYLCSLCTLYAYIYSCIRTTRKAKKNMPSTYNPNSHAYKICAAWKKKRPGINGWTTRPITVFITANNITHLSFFFFLSVYIPFCIIPYSRWHKFEFHSCFGKAPTFHRQKKRRNTEENKK